MNYPKVLAELTATQPSDWEEISGPTTGVGSEHWFVHLVAQLTAYICNDQGHVTISVGDELLYSGQLEEDDIPETR